jgi:hypothetical protein
VAPNAKAVASGKYCGAPKRAEDVRGEPCRNAAGFKTNHPGVGRCFLHGGRNRITHGRYSGIQRESLRSLIEQHESDPDPLNILPELAAARALFQDFAERYDAFRDALIAWHASHSDAYREARAAYLVQRGDKCEACDGTGFTGDAEEPNPLAFVDRPRSILDIADAHRLVSEVTKIVERIEAIRARNAVSRPELHRVIAEMWRVLELNVQDSTLRQQIRDGWLGIRL